MGNKGTEVTFERDECCVTEVSLQLLQTQKGSEVIVGSLVTTKIPERTAAPHRHTLAKNMLYSEEEEGAAEEGGEENFDCVQRQDV